MLTIAVCATCGPHGKCDDCVKSQSCDCDPGFQETDIDGEKVCENIDDCGGAGSVGSRDHDSRRCGGQTTSQEFFVRSESQTSDFLFMYRTEQEDRADLVAELGATSEAFRTKIDDFERSVAASDADPKAASAIRKKERHVCE